MQGSPRIDELRQKFHENPRRYFAPLANEYRKAGDPEQAIAICRAHLAQQPGHMSGHVVYGQALYDARRPDEARTVFEKALSLDPDNAIVLRQLGDIAREKGDTSEARHWYGKALDTDPSDSEVAAYIAELAEPLVVETGSVESVAEEPVVAETEEPVAAETDATAVGAAPAEEKPEADLAPIESKQPESDDVAWRKTPRPEESPFVTRTMADLYAQQGHREAALDVYRQLATRHPDDDGIRERILELSIELIAMPESELPSEPPASPSDAAPAEQIDDLSQPLREVEAANVPPSFAELSDDPLFAPLGDELSIPSDLVAPVDDGKHFTEAELSEGDAWDSDAWAAGFAADEVINPEFASGDAGHDETVVTPGSAAKLETEDVIEEIELASEVAAVSEYAPEPAPESDAESKPESEPDETGVVAYSPEAPPDDELAHFTPKLPTVRELFATLGARRPPAIDAQQSYTARASIPGGSHDLSRNQPVTASGVGNPDVFALPTDAFANLFPESAVSEEDTRAAFALSGALSSTGHSPLPSSVQTSPPHPSPAVTVPTPGQNEESEEEIRRFREWLDGLAES